jgi:hypothetical protein
MCYISGGCVVITLCKSLSIIATMIFFQKRTFLLVLYTSLREWFQIFIISKSQEVLKQQVLTIEDL